MHQPFLLGYIIFAWTLLTPSRLHMLLAQSRTFTVISAHLCNFLVFLSQTVSYGTIRNYVSSFQIFYELHHIHVDLFHNFYISLTLRSIKHLHGYSPQAKLPITPQSFTKYMLPSTFLSPWTCSFGLLAF